MIYTAQRTLEKEFKEQMKYSAINYEGLIRSELISSIVNKAIEEKNIEVKTINERPDIEIKEIKLHIMSDEDFETKIKILRDILNSEDMKDVSELSKKIIYDLFRR